MADERKRSGPITAAEALEMMIEEDGDGSIPLDRMMVGGYLRNARQLVGLTVQKAADQLGISQGHLSKIERGLLKKIPRIAILKKAAVLYGIPIEELLNVAGIEPVEIPPNSLLTAAGQFVNLMFHDMFGPPGMKTEYLPHIPQLHRNLSLQMARQVWEAGRLYGETGEGPHIDDILRIHPEIDEKVLGIAPYDEDPLDDEDEDPSQNVSEDPEEEADDE